LGKAKGETALLSVPRIDLLSLSEARKAKAAPLILGEKREWPLIFEAEQGKEGEKEHDRAKKEESVKLSLICLGGGGEGEEFQNTREKRNR